MTESQMHIYHCLFFIFNLGKSAKAGTTIKDSVDASMCLELFREFALSMLSMPMINNVNNIVQPATSQKLFLLNNHKSHTPTQIF